MKRKQKTDKPRILRWKGLLAGAARRVRIGVFALLAIGVAALVFAQLGVVGLGVLGSYTAYGNVLLTAVALGGLLFGIPLGTLLGLFAGVMMYVHSLVQPLDYFEITSVTPLTSVFLFLFLGFFISFLFAVALRRNPPLVRRIVYIVIICLTVSMLYSIAFVLNAMLAMVMQLFEISQYGSLSIGDAAAQNVALMGIGQLGRVDLQFVFNAGLMIACSIIADVVVRKGMRNNGRHSLLTIMRGWLAGIVIAVFAITSGIGFVVVTEQAKETAADEMSDELDYLCNQLDIYDTRAELLAQLFQESSGNADEQSDAEAQALDAEPTESEEALIRRAFSIDGLLEGYKKDEDGTIVIFDDEAVLLSNDPNFLPGDTITSLFGESGKRQIGQLASSGEMVQTMFNVNPTGRLTRELLDEVLERPISLQMSFMGAREINEYTVLIVYPATKVFSSRIAVMAATTLSVLVMLVVVFVFFSFMINRIVLRRIDETNGVLAQITEGDLTAKVDISGNREFASLSEGINTTVDALRGWIAEAETRMEAELNTAKAIQESALPRIFPPFPDIHSFDIYASMHAAREVGGDFYDFFLIGEDSGPDRGRLGFVLADVSGKGVPAALFMMTAKTLLRDYMSTGIELGEAVENANRQLCDGNDAGMFVTVFAGILDYPSGHVTYVNAGHNPPLLWQQGSWRWLTERSGLPLGLFDDFPYGSFEIDCSIGDEFFIYTDGVTEAMNVDGELYGEDRLEALMNEHFDMHPRKLIGAVRNDVAAHARGAEQSDDITMLSLEVGVPPEITSTLVVPASVSELPNVIEFIHAELESRMCPVKAQKQLDIAVEEMFVNVAHYAYPDATPDNPGTARIGCTYSADPPSMTVEIADDGIPFNPLAKPDAQTPDNIMDVPIGGLGIFMAKKSVDEFGYERIDGSNVVTLKKAW